ncbi:MAG: hypothetical protein QNJ88_01680 [Acidimicrobiia bacterium]|nr:hypothetical protein [Acidimicrobiia bacterium]
MLLRERSDQAVELSIVGYQFENASDEWDRNWLVVEGHVHLPGQEWRFRDPCLTTWEAHELAAWLSNVSAARSADTAISFTEPNLCFEWQGVSSEFVEVRVSFELEARPAEMRNLPWGGCYVDLTIGRSDLAAAGTDLLLELMDYPQR